MPCLAVCVLAYAATLVMAIAAALAHPWSGDEARFVQAVAEASRLAPDGAPGPTGPGHQPP